MAPAVKASLALAGMAAGFASVVGGVVLLLAVLGPVAFVASFALALMGFIFAMVWTDLHDHYSRKSK